MEKIAVSNEVTNFEYNKQEKNYFQKSQEVIKFVDILGRLDSRFNSKVNS